MRAEPHSGAERLLSVPPACPDGEESAPACSAGRKAWAQARHQARGVAEAPRCPNGANPPRAKTT